jgi:FkbM family methyltransferase
MAKGFSAEGNCRFAREAELGMALTMLLREAALATRLFRGKRITLGGRTYRIRGLFVNKLALLRSFGSSEAWLDCVYETALKCRPGLFLDVGANVGQTLFKILALDSTRPYLGFEPQVSCCFLIQQFVEDNRLKDHTILPVGLSDKNHSLKLFVRDAYYDTAASMVEGFRPDSFYVSHRYVCVRKGDEVISELGAQDLCAIKIDVEGAELEVVEGLSNTLKQKRPVIIFEVLNHFLVGTGRQLDESTIRFRESRVQKVEAILRNLGYEIFNILPGKRLKKLLRIEPPASADLSLTNYLAVSKLDLDSFLRAFPGSVEEASFS